MSILTGILTNAANHLQTTAQGPQLTRLNFKWHFLQLLVKSEEVQNQKSDKNSFLSDFL